MEKLLNSRRSWSGSLTTAHVSGSILSGPTPTEAELLLALEWTVRRHPLLRAIVVGRGKHYVPDAKPFALHDNYLQKAIEGKPELFRPEPDSDPPRFEPSILAAAELARRGLTVDDPSSDVSADLKLRFSRALDELSFDPCGDGPLWSLRLIPPAKGGKGSALLWAANHAISDQLSHNQVLADVLSHIGRARKGAEAVEPTELPLPPSVEAAIVGPSQLALQGEEPKARVRNIFLKLARPSSLSYSAFQCGASGAIVLPRWTPPADKLGEEYSSTQRTTLAAFESVSGETTAALRAVCRDHGVTISAALNAAAMLCATDVLGAESDRVEAETKALTRRYKLLQALNMRSLGGPEKNGLCGHNRETDGDWSNGSVVAGTGSLDILIDLPYNSVAAVCDALLQTGDSPVFWETARQCASQTKAWLANGWARESLLLFGAGWEFMNMNRVVELGAQDRTTLGRAYSCGTSNAGVFAHDEVYDGLKLEAIYFGISQSVSAPSISVSCLTVGGALCLCTQWCSPIWNGEQGSSYARAVREMLELVASTRDNPAVAQSAKRVEQMARS